MNVPREPILKSENEGDFFFPRFARTDRRYAPLHYLRHGSAELEPNPQILDPPLIRKCGHSQQFWQRGKLNRVSTFGRMEWNSGMDYWNGGMLHSTYLIIQHVLYSEQYLITGNIRVCCGRGCQQKYSKLALPPHNLCV